MDDARSARWYAQTLNTSRQWSDQDLLGLVFCLTARIGVWEELEHVHFKGKTPIGLGKGRVYLEGNSYVPEELEKMVSHTFRKSEKAGDF